MLIFWLSEIRILVLNSPSCFSLLSGNNKMQIWKTHWRDTFLHHDMPKPKENIVKVLQSSQWPGREEYAIDASALVNPVAGRMHLGLRAPLQTRRSRRTEFHDWLLVEVPSVQHHQFLGSILPRWYRAKSEKGAQSRSLCTPSAHSRGMITLSESGA